MKLRSLLVPALTLTFTLAVRGEAPASPSLMVNSAEYLEKPGLNVMLAHDFYPEGHQGGVSIIQNGQRVATNGDLRLQPTPGQWQPTPAVVGSRQIDRETQEISVRMRYPDETKDRHGFNPITYPDLKLTYAIKVRPSGEGFLITVDLDQPLPAEWVGKVGFNFELYPGVLFGKSYRLGDQVGTFPRQGDGPGSLQNGEFQLEPLGHGSKLIVAPETPAQRLSIESLKGGELSLLDGRAQHNNGWFVVRALVPAGATREAIQWLVVPHTLPDWKSTPVIQLSQVGYHPAQEKIAVIELDKSDSENAPATLYQVDGDITPRVVLREQPQEWGRFIRYRYLRFDFSRVSSPGLYVLEYRDQRSAVFPITPAVFQRGVWQPTVEYFLPVQMCHMRVNDNYRVWHGLCHADDALMAPVNHNHFDGYAQGPSTLTSFQGGDHVPDLDHGGWHDAGDYDIRLESQADTVQGLAVAWELFHPTLDVTTVDQVNRVVDIHRPDGKPDVLQQIEHGVLSMVGAYHSLGRLYAGIQDATLHQYTHLGDAHDMTDNRVFHDDNGRALKVLAEAARVGDQREPAVAGLPPLGSDGSADDRWVFTEQNPPHEYAGIAALSAAFRALKGYNDALAQDCLKISEELWKREKHEQPSLFAVNAAIELLLSTGKSEYADAVIATGDLLVSHVATHGWLGARALPLIKDAGFHEKILAALRAYAPKLKAAAASNPYGFPYQAGHNDRDIWGKGWDVQRFGVAAYYLNQAAPDLYPREYLFHALDFVLGCHPGANNASFVSGVGAKSMIPAYGFNRADWSYIPGGISSGTAIIRPDYPELLEWPFLWQQGEYCLGYPTSDYVFLVLAADHLLNSAAAP